MSSSSATHDTLSRQPPWRGVASPHVLLMPTVLLALAVLFQAVDIRLTKRAFDVIINDTTALSALVAITVAAIGAITSIAMRSRHRVAAPLNWRPLDSHWRRDGPCRLQRRSHHR
jgi:hypothetical protein